jgi:hypothetical protein
LATLYITRRSTNELVLEIRELLGYMA